MATEAEYEREHLRNLKQYQNEVEQEYLSTIKDVFTYVALYRYAQKVFKLDDYPILKSQIEERLGTFRTRITNIIKSGIDKEFKLSDKKNLDVLVTKIGERVRREIQPTPNSTIDEFTNRHTRRLTLSDRVWKLSNQFQSQIETTLSLGIQEGKAANKMATEMKVYLKEPDRLFRRVRDSKGKLVLSENANRYHPGTGIYRSSYKNALRMTRTETNRAYRGADYNRWSTSPFILGIEVKLSRNHPKFDMCDGLCGVFPANYKHTGFHINCLCYAVPILPTPEEFNAYQDSVLAGTKFVFKGKVKEIHTRAKQWIRDNAERVEGYKVKPLFMLDNPKFIQKVLQE